MSIEAFPSPSSERKPPKTVVEPLVHLIYASRPFGFDDLSLGGILATARRNNLRDDITGALICREDLFLQLLEGPKTVVEAAFARIERDDRHTEIRHFVSEPILGRLFPNWAMRHDPARSWMWTRDQVTAGAVAAANPNDVIGIFQRLAKEPPATPQDGPFGSCPVGHA